MRVKWEYPRTPVFGRDFPYLFDLILKDEQIGEEALALSRAQARRQDEEGQLQLESEQASGVKTNHHRSRHDRTMATSLRRLLV